MDIENIGEFAKFCQGRYSDANLVKTIESAEQWADFSVALSRQYGGHGQGMEVWVEEAFQRQTAEDGMPGQKEFLATSDILSGFWVHRVAFNKWFNSKVIIFPTANGISGENVRPL